MMANERYLIFRQIILVNIVGMYRERYRGSAHFPPKIERHKVQLLLYYIHFEIAQIQDLVRSNIFIDTVLSRS